MSLTHDYTVISFSPPMPCVATDCQELTDQALVSISNPQEMVFAPYCPMHGYAYSVPPEQERASFIRFVMSEHEGKGSAQYLSTVPLDSIPNFQQENGAQFDTLVWAAYWIDEQGIGHRQYVTWEPDYLAFTLYEEDEQ